ncbi:MAG: valine--tRNA ligase [Acidimicrobiia bacterium]|nr:valine--tRNA ligase [Acidimicrobiia bacterium]
MEPTYDPKAVESRWYAVWEHAGAFRPEVNPDGEPYTIVIPPPNVTGQLHMGHALDQSIQDLIIRRKRMQGFAALWVPGSDHAGIATQNVVERELAAEGLTRHHLGREEFIERVWDWKARLGNRITQQIRRMGFSPDWSRERFTLDDGLSAAVRKVFVSLYDEGIIYRGERIINWCPRCMTALSDIEVEHEDESGELVHITYPFTDGDGGVTVATTRAETMLGDTGVAVHPDDERYRDAIGKTVRLPLMNRDIPIVADDAVDAAFGTGAVKVTPAHDPLDFEIAERHGLPAIKVLDETAVVTEAGGQFAGLDRFVARKAVKEALSEIGALGLVEDHPHSVGHCYRCGTVVEPFLSRQWFVKVDPLVGPSIDVFKDGTMQFVPKRWENSYFHWMENLRDWCISRQIWWGHRIPAWYCDSCGETVVSMDDPQLCACGSEDLRQDPDVLDTWFSSALWPFSTLGWPEETEDLARFYPNSVLVTGYDIIYFWVARMIKMGIHFMGRAPYPDVVIHGLVRAPDGRKMSKSLGNTVDPLEVAEEYGADALRLALIQAAAAGHEVPFQIEWVDAARRFGNKLWNAVRFVLPHLEGVTIPAAGGYPTNPRPESAWILHRLQVVTARVDELLDEYKMAEAYNLLYSFAWSEVFDWYLEMAKSPLRGEDREETALVVGIVVRDILKLFHPVIPYVTEELWGELIGEGLLITASWPEPLAYPEPEHMSEVQELIVGIRRFRAEHHVSPKTPINISVTSPAGADTSWWGEQFRALANVDATVVAAAPEAKGHSRLVAGPLQAFIPLAGLVDVAAERPRLEKAVAEAQAVLAASQRKLANESFVAKAPSEVVEKERAKVAETEMKVSKLQAQLEELG